MIHHNQKSYAFFVGLCLIFLSSASYSATPAPTHSSRSQALYELYKQRPNAEAAVIYAEFRKIFGGFAEPQAPSTEAVFTRTTAALSHILSHLNEQAVGSVLIAELSLDKLEELLKDKTAEPEAYRSLLLGLFGDRDEFSDPTFVELRRELKTLVARLALVKDLDRSEKTYDQNLFALSVAWAEVRSGQGRAAVDEQRTSQALLWFRDSGLAPDLCLFFETFVFLPNIYIYVEKAAIDQAIKRVAVDQDHVKIDTVSSQGIHITGSGTLRGNLSAELATNADFAQINLRFRGAMAAQTAGNMGRIATSTASTTNIDLIQPLRMTGLGLSVLDSWIGVTSNVTSVGAKFQRRRDPRGRGRPLIDRIITNQIIKQSGQIEAESAAKTKMQIATEIGKKVNEMMPVYENFLNVKLYGQLSKADISLHDKSASSATAAMFRFGVRSPFASTTVLVPRTVGGTYASKNGNIRMAAHESALNNLSVLLNDSEILETDFREMIFEKLSVRVDDADSDVPGRMPATVTFAKSAQPFRIDIANNRLNFTIHIRSFNAEGRDFGARSFVLKASYEMQTNAGKLSMMRVGDVSAQPESIAADDADLKALMTIAPNFLPNKLTGKPSDIIMKEKKFASMQVDHIDLTEDHWLHLDWSLNYDDKK
jgi:hypothetical protein